jgi:hypothetical protein
MIHIFIDTLLHLWWVFAALIAAGVLTAIHKELEENDDWMEVADAVEEGPPARIYQFPTKEEVTT